MNGPIIEVRGTMDLLGFCAIYMYIVLLLLLFSVRFEFFGSAPSSHVANACNSAWINLAPCKFNFIVVLYALLLLLFLGLSFNLLMILYGSN